MKTSAPLAALILGKLSKSKNDDKKSEDEEDSVTSEDNDEGQAGLEAAMNDFMRAIERKNASKAVSALKDFIDICQECSEEHDE